MHSEAYCPRVGTGHDPPSPQPAGHTANFRLGPWFFFPSPKPQIHRQVSTAAPEHTWAPPFPPLMLNPRPKPGLSLPPFKPLVHVHAGAIWAPFPELVRPLSSCFTPVTGCPVYGEQGLCSPRTLSLRSPLPVAAARGQGFRERPLTPLPGARPSSSSLTTSSPRPLPATPQHQLAAERLTLQCLCPGCLQEPVHPGEGCAQGQPCKRTAASGSGCGWGWRPWRGRVPDGSRTPQPLGAGGSPGEAFSSYMHQPPTLLPDLPGGEPSGSCHHMEPEWTQDDLGDPQTQSSQHQSRAPETGGATGKDTI